MIVIDENLNKVKPGNIGEICIAGKGVSRGYLNRPEETAKNFIDNPFALGEKMYLSGDLGLLRSDGSIEFIKRKDEQVMINGKRVEPLEIENVLYKMPEIREAIVRSYQDLNDFSYLVGYIRSENEVSVSDIEAHLARFVPKFMIPEFWVKVDKFTKTLNGKIDRRSLPLVMK